MVVRPIQKTFSTIIPSLNAPLIAEVVAALRTQHEPQLLGEIIVVGRDAPGLVPPGVTFIETVRPVPAAQARNLGAARATGSHLLFIDADCIAAPDLVTWHAAAHQGEGRAVCGGVAFEESDYWTLCDNLLSFTPFLAMAPAGERRYLPSLNLSLRRELFLELGGFDEGYPGAAGEDVDLSLRLRERGVTLWFEPQARVLHRPQRGTPGAVWRHLRGFGRVHVRLQRRFAGRASPRLSLRWRPFAPLLMAGAPLLALADALMLYRRNPPLRRFPHTLPGLAWGRIAWYWGVAEGLMICG